MPQKKSRLQSAFRRAMKKGASRPLVTTARGNICSGKVRCAVAGGLFKKLVSGFGFSAVRVVRRPLL
jgi:hypothetical protein